MASELEALMMDATNLIAETTRPVVDFLESARDLIDAIASELARPSREKQDSSSA